MEAKKNGMDGDRKELVRLLKEGRLEIVKREVFGLGVLAMLDSGDYLQTLT
jgi:hypothetical protein